MIDFSTLQGLTIPEGVVTQIEDASGRVLWAVSGGKAILEVAKITSDTYAGETTYTGEEFILLDIYPKTNGTVRVTYGGLTKTITDITGTANPNAQRVYFGTLYGETDDVATPSSGTLTIQGEFRAYGNGSFSETKFITERSRCIKNIIEWGNPTSIPAYAFEDCDNLINAIIPDSVTSIGNYAFNACDSLASVVISNNITSLGSNTFSNCPNLQTNSYDNCKYLAANDNPYYALIEVTNKDLSSCEIHNDTKVMVDSAFSGCGSLTNIILPNGLKYIPAYAFDECNNLSLTNLPSEITSIGDYAFFNCWRINISNFPSSLVSIGAFAFNMDSGAHYIKNGTEYKNNWEGNEYHPGVAMYNKSIILPSTIQRVGEAAFARATESFADTTIRCTYLSNITILATTPPTMGSFAFGYGGIYPIDTTVKVPKDCVDAYKTALKNAGFFYTYRITEVS